MRNYGCTLFVTLTLLCSCIEICNKSNQVVFDEMADPTADTLSDWSGVPKGINTSFVSVDTRYPKSKVPDVTVEHTAILTGWKGEKLSAQMLIWSSEALEHVECIFSDFSSEQASMPPEVARCKFVGYVMADIFGGEHGCTARVPGELPFSLSADIIHHLGWANIKAKTVRPLWITIEIPHTAAAGKYEGELIVSAKGTPKQRLKVVLNVIDRTLPPASQWQFHLDMWQHPAAVARIENVKVWSDEHFEAMRPVMKMLADGGQKVITVNMNKDPWNNQCYDPYADMILWTKKTDGTWAYNFDAFDKWVEFMLGLGINKMINCYSLLPWNDEIHYFDQASLQMVNISAKPGTALFNEVWEPFLIGFSNHLLEKDWLHFTNIAMDERSPEAMECALEILGRVAPEFGIALADNHKSYKKYPYIRDLCVAPDGHVDRADIIARREMGLNTTYYVCCMDKFPNMFAFSSPAESVYAIWHAIACDYDGFLRWAYNSWTETPMLDARFRTWPSGDTYIVYPNGRSSIRFERLIEGVQDVEKIRIIRRELSNDSTPEATENLRKLNETILNFASGTPSDDWMIQLNDAKTFLNSL